MELVVIPALLVAGAIVGWTTAWIGFTQWYEAGLWLLLLASAAFLAGIEGWVDVAAFVGLAGASGAVAGLVQTRFITRYRGNNPWYEEETPSSTAAVSKLFAGSSALRAGMIAVVVASVAAFIPT